jgi:hypothetical protein
MGDEDEGFLALLLPLAADLEVAIDLGQDVGNVRLPLLKYSVVEGLEDLLVVGIDLGEGPLGLDPLLPDDPLDPRPQGGVVADEEMGIADKGVLLAHPVADLVLKTDEFRPGPVDRPLEATQLIFDLGGRDRFAPRGENDALREQRLAHGDPGRDADPPQPHEFHRLLLFLSEPLVDELDEGGAGGLLVLARTAERMLVPWGAARVRMPRMLLPSISRLSLAMWTAALKRLAVLTNLTAARA